MKTRVTFLGLCLFAFAAGCHSPQISPEPAASASANEGGHDPPKKEDGEKSSSKEKGPSSRKMPVPFAWEAAHADDLAKTRAFLRDALEDNEAYMHGHDKAFFKAFADAQKPRATFVTCADSRVQTDAIDAHPENDVFTIRDIGNQFGLVEGSIEYGVHHLHTPVLAIMGHTGCGAVKAAMGDFSKESEAIQRELKPLKLPKSTAKDANQAWAEAVIANVNNQVDQAVTTFSDEISEGRLTVVGMVYDFRNDLKMGYGKVLVVNVNGNTDPKMIDAFQNAVLKAAPEPAERAPEKVEKTEKRAEKAERSASAGHESH
jgi:carbonic anhydrase